jgi:hypothetical protein
VRRTQHPEDQSHAILQAAYPARSVRDGWLLLEQERGQSSTGAVGPADAGQRREPGRARYDGRFQRSSGHVDQSVTPRRPAPRNGRIPRCGTDVSRRSILRTSPPGFARPQWEPRATTSASGAPSSASLGLMPSKAASLGGMSTVRTERTHEGQEESKTPHLCLLTGCIRKYLVGIENRNRKTRPDDATYA